MGVDSVVRLWNFAAMLRRWRAPERLLAALAVLTVVAPSRVAPAATNSASEQTAPVLDPGAQALLDRAEEHFAGGDYEEAADLYRQARDAVPDTVANVPLRAMIDDKLATTHRNAYTSTGDREHLHVARRFLVEYERALEDIHKEDFGQLLLARKEVQMRLARLDELLDSAPPDPPASPEVDGPEEAEPAPEPTAPASAVPDAETLARAQKEFHRLVERQTRRRIAGFVLSGIGAVFAVTGAVIGGFSFSDGSRCGTFRCSIKVDTKLWTVLTGPSIGGVGFISSIFGGVLLAKGMAPVDRSSESLEQDKQRARRSWQAARGVGFGLLGVGFAALVAGAGTGGAAGAKWDSIPADDPGPDDLPTVQEVVTLGNTALSLAIVAPAFIALGAGLAAAKNASRHPITWRVAPWMGRKHVGLGIAGRF